MTGTIRDSTGNNWWNLTTGELNINATVARLDGSPIETEESTQGVRYDVTEMMQHFRIRPDAGLEIVCDDGTSIVLSSGEVIITNSASESTDILGDDMTTGSATISDFLLLGNHKLLARSNGTNTTLVYVGD